MKIIWKGKGLKEKGFNSKGFPIIECDKNYFRPLDVNTLLGRCTKSKKKKLKVETSKKYKYFNR